MRYSTKDFSKAGCETIFLLKNNKNFQEIIWVQKIRKFHDNYKKEIELIREKGRRKLTVALSNILKL